MCLVGGGVCAMDLTGHFGAGLFLDGVGWGVCGGGWG